MDDRPDMARSSHVPGLAVLAEDVSAQRGVAAALTLRGVVGVVDDVPVSLPVDVHDCARRGGVLRARKRCEVGSRGVVGGGGGGGGEKKQRRKEKRGNEERRRSKKHSHGSSWVPRSSFGTIFENLVHLPEKTTNQVINPAFLYDRVC